VSLQFVLHRHALDNGIENRSSPSSTDTREYVGRAEVFANGIRAGEGFPKAFSQAFRDGYRTPGYPVFLAVFPPLFDKPLQAARCAQILLSGAIVVLAFLTFRNLLRSKQKAFLGAVLVGVWPPLYYFSPILIAESCSLFVLAALLWVLSRRPEKTPRFLSWIAASPLFAILVYLKPNHFLLLLPVAVFLWICATGTEKPTRIQSLSFVALSIALLAPWSLFLSLNNGRPVFLSTASGVNLYLGTGVVQDPGDSNTLPSRFAARTGMASDSGDATAALTQNASPQEASQIYAREARSVWSQHPVRTSLYGVAKILHGFGFSFRGLRDGMMVLLLAAALFFSVRLYRFGGPGKAWAFLFWGVLLVTISQLFLYLPNQRLKTVLFDLPALLTLVLGMFGPGTDPESAENKKRG
jgi:4-amino-4-deoxy-L-arabinose transferase-like glycosyltransferase